MTTDQKIIIRNRIGLLELAKQLGNVSQACKILGYSRDSFYRYKGLYETDGEAALADISKKKPIVKNRVDPEIEETVVQLAFDVPDELLEIPEPKPGAIQVSDDGSFKQIVPADTTIWMK